jgi:hypothetical protein
MADIKEIVTNNSTDALERILSPFIEEQFPLFMRSEYRKLIAFIKAYYEWLEQKDNSGYVLAHMDSVTDVDENLNQFYSHFRHTYLDGFPSFFATNTDGETPNEKTVLKKIREFYGNKGTEGAYEFVFRVLYDSDVNFYYPKEDIIKASDGRWIESRSIKTTSLNGMNLFVAKGGQIVQNAGSETRASAFVDSVVQYTANGLPVTEFFLTNISGEFLPEQNVTIQTAEGDYTEYAYSVLGELFIELPGNGYSVGEYATVIDTTGAGFKAKIEQTGYGGSIKKVSIINSGLRYFADSLVLTIISANGKQTAKIIGVKTAITNYPGYFQGNHGKVSSNKHIQDGNYYQDFSYELKSEVSFDRYFSVLKTIAHPAGMRMFGSILVKRGLQNTPVSSSQMTEKETPIVGKYTPYKFGTTLDLRANGVTSSGYWLGATGDLYPLGYNPFIGSTLQAGPSGKTTSLGTLFVGTSLGYTYCYVPEGGRTAHNPIGAPLGSTTSWYSGNESRLSPQGMRGLVLWLKPENIGVCGSVANGASMDFWLDASPSGNHAVPPTWDRWTTNGAYAGVTVDQLRPTLVINDNGVVGATGISFDGGVICGPQTVWNEAGVYRTSGYEFRSGYTLGTSLTFVPGSTGEKLLVGRHFYLKNGITFTADMDVIMVYRPVVDSPYYGLGLVSSNKKFTDSYFKSFSDYIIFSRSWNSVDANPAQQTSKFYTIASDGTKRYPTGTGMIGMRPWGAVDYSGIIPIDYTFNRVSISYDPHVSGASTGVVVGEVAREKDGLYAFANGDPAINQSRSTGIRVSANDEPYSDSRIPLCDAAINIGRFGAYHLSGVSSDNVFGTASWVRGVTANPSYGFRGVLYEVIVFNRKLNDQERKNVYGYLSRKYKLDAALPDSYKQAHPSTYPFGVTYWAIQHHPNTKNLTTIPSGISFSGITLTNFFNMPILIYKSEGTVLANGTVLTGDTYTSV